MGQLQSNSIPVAEVLLSTRSLSLHFDEGRTRALNGVDIEIRKGEFVAITGPSGCGKSSLLNLIGTLDTPTSGELFFKGNPYSTIPDASLFRREEIGFVFQSFHLIPTLSAFDNVLVPTVGRNGEKNAGERGRELLEMMGLQARMAHFPGQLSGGERQRVAIARALINDPAIILADEPTGSLDSANAAHVLDIFTRIRSQRPVTIIMVTHDTGVADRADREIRMRDGLVTDTEAHS